jgi:hypothetical protein
MELCAAQKNSAQRVAKEGPAPFFGPSPTIQLVIFFQINGKSGAVLRKDFRRFYPVLHKI